MLDVTPDSLLRSIFHTLAYADVFEYPLTASEVYRYLTSKKASFSAVSRALAENTLFSKVGEYFTLPDREQIVGTRRRRATVAARLWPWAARYGRLLASLPFVRMVAVTGSLAMSNVEAGNDVDFMIVTAPRRLWTCRALCLTIARFARLRGLILCPNFLVTTQALELTDRSLYVAHELAQMIPLSGMEIYAEMRRVNDWTTEYLPNASSAPGLPPGIESQAGSPVLQRVLQALLGLPILDWFEKWEMRRKMSRLRREQSVSKESYFSPDVCKGHVDRHGENTEHMLLKRMMKLPPTAAPGEAADENLPAPVEKGMGWGV